MNLNCARALRSHTLYSGGISSFGCGKGGHYITEQHNNPDDIKLHIQDAVQQQ